MRVAFRVDANAQMGTGHISRCLSLADELKAIGAQCSFFSRYMPDYFIEQIYNAGHHFCRLGNSMPEPYKPGLSHHSWLGVDQSIDAVEMIDSIGENIMDWVIVDHYSLDAKWEKYFKTDITKILVIDDLSDRFHACNILLNQSVLDNNILRYQDKVADDCRILLGPSYSLLRPKFRELHKKVSSHSGLIQRILVFFGGIDSNGHTNKILNALSNPTLLNIHVDVVVGLLHPFLDEIKGLCREHGFHLHIQTLEMAELMFLADLCVGSGGSVVWERCCLGLPAITFAVAPNQEELVQGAALNGLLYSPNVQAEISESINTHINALIQNPNLLKLISTNGFNAVDGYGACRVARALGMSQLVLRKAEKKDTKNIFEWRNHPSITKVSKNQDPIEWETHVGWFNSMLACDTAHILIGELAGDPVGVVRFDVRSQEATVSIYLVPGISILGIGTDILNASEMWLKNANPQIKAIYAEVLGENERSENLFFKNGYKMTSLNFKKEFVKDE